MQDFTLLGVHTLFKLLARLQHLLAGVQRLRDELLLPGHQGRRPRAVLRDGVHVQSVLPHVRVVLLVERLCVGDVPLRILVLQAMVVSRLARRRRVQHEVITPLLRDFHDSAVEDVLVLL